jgi:hypothetical protein
VIVPAQHPAANVKSPLHHYEQNGVKRSTAADNLPGSAGPIGTPSLENECIFNALELQL